MFMWIADCHKHSAPVVGQFLLYFLQLLLLRKFSHAVEPSLLHSTFYPYTTKHATSLSNVTLITFAAFCGLLGSPNRAHVLHVLHALSSLVQEDVPVFAARLSPPVPLSWLFDAYTQHSGFAALLRRSEAVPALVVIRPAFHLPWAGVEEALGADGEAGDGRLDEEGKAKGELRRRNGQVVGQLRHDAGAEAAAEYPCEAEPPYDRAYYASGLAPASERGLDSGLSPEQMRQRGRRSQPLPERFRLPGHISAAGSGPSPLSRPPDAPVRLG